MASTLEGLEWEAEKLRAPKGLVWALNNEPRARAQVAMATSSQLL